VSAPAFTPGPWEAWRTPEEGVVAVRRRYTREDGSRVTEWPATCSCNTLDNMANARLIAAAPEMFDTLEKLRADLVEEDADRHAQRIAVIDLTLAQARGEQ
jgi:hypothetical protein